MFDMVIYELEADTIVIDDTCIVKCMGFIVFFLSTNLSYCYYMVCGLLLIALVTNKMYSIIM